MSEIRETDAGKVKIHLPQLMPEHINSALLMLRENRHFILNEDENKIKNQLSLHIKMWLDRNYKPRKLAESLLPITLGYSKPMVVAILDSLFRKLDHDLEFLEKGSKSREILVSVFPDIPGPQVVAVIQALLNGMAVYCKAPYQEPLFTALYLSSLRDVDESLAKCVVVTSWEGGKNENQILENALYGDLTEKDMIVIFGSPEVTRTIDAMRNQTTSLVTYSRGIGIIAIGIDHLRNERIQDTLESCARAISLYNGNSCFSPQSIIIEDKGETSPQSFSKSLSNLMTRIAQNELPVGDLSGDAYAKFIQTHRTYRIQSLRGSLEYHPVNDVQGRPIGGVALINDGNFALPRGGQRVVTVFPIGELAQSQSILLPYEHQIHSVGLGLDSANYIKIKDVFEKMGSRVSSIEDMLNLSFEDYLFLDE